MDRLADVIKKWVNMDAKRYVVKPSNKGWSKLLVIYGITAVILVAACVFVTSCSRSKS